MSTNNFVSVVNVPKSSASDSDYDGLPFTRPIGPNFWINPEANNELTFWDGKNNITLNPESFTINDQDGKSVFGRTVS